VDSRSLRASISSGDCDDDAEDLILRYEENSGRVWLSSDSTSLSAVSMTSCRMRGYHTLELVGRDLLHLSRTSSWPPHFKVYFLFTIDSYG
jgi:hypothetical protein